ncbi:MAG: hypothetical protein UX19_C0002G0044 [Candidatus Woesebacteria bacterium GW2011_GWA1_45_8]|uniref:ABC transporter permease protein n=1 Tax=Candidatus Woesebacteria bacterium GW2011_GWA1_45_8 TaxID=1618559 RepID=A0A0G1MVX9_9BACT|nr:MAG: hypothetical protein UX19_C0002G0044 [Candidatus Woesebacteria bacterium GW2011_GWA1_45_8]
MRKYLSIFRISFAQEFAYRANFIMWRIRNVMQIFLVFFLWDAVFTDPNRLVFGYDRSKILTYVFSLLLIKSIVLSTRTIDVAGEIARGELTNYLLKPINYFRYWFTRDLSTKLLNLLFAIFETSILVVLLRPPLFLQNDPYILGLFLISLALAVVLYFLILLIFSLFPFWYPEQGWGALFILFIFTEFAGGGLFPLDILPQALQKGLYLTPFPYLLFMPLQIYLGKLGVLGAFKALTVSAAWVGLLTVMLRKLWSLGLKAYRAEGR